MVLLNIISHKNNTKKLQYKKIFKDPSTHPSTHPSILKMNFLEIVQEHCDFYCLCYNNFQKHTSMKNRFRQLNIDLIIYEGVPPTDQRIKNTEQRKNTEQAQRLWSVTYGHLDMIRLFYDSGKTFGFFCEDDIVVNKRLIENIPHIMSEFNEMKLDLLLLGYMKTYKIEEWMQEHQKKHDFDNRPYTYHHYPHDQWGVHLYMLNREGAKKILDKYANGFADEHPEVPFSPDWTISKCGNTALISPMFAVEDGKDPFEHYGHVGQYEFHMNTFSFNNIPDLFI